MSAAEKIDTGEQYLTRDQVCSKLGFKSLTSLYVLAKKHPDFPRPRKTGVSRQSAVRYPPRPSQDHLPSAFLCRSSQRFRPFGETTK